MTENEATREMTFEEEYQILQKEKEELFAMENCDSEPPFANSVVRRASRCIRKLLEEIQQYRAIGTIEEFKALKEKNEPKKILYRKQSYGTPWLCPYCEADQIKVEFFSEDGSEPKEKYTFCWQCGTRIDWSE